MSTSTAAVILGVTVVLAGTLVILAPRIERGAYLSRLFG